MPESGLKFPSLPDPPDLSDVFRAFPHGVRPLMEFHDVLLRGDSPLAVEERELIAAYVSGLNACNYCAAAHSTIARAFGVDADLFEALQKDLNRAPVNDKLKPLLEYVAKLTLQPSKISAADADAVYAAGWNERALYDAVLVCALFNFMNRLVDGTGCAPEAEAAGENPDEPLMSYFEWAQSVGLLD